METSAVVFTQRERERGEGRVRERGGGVKFGSAKRRKLRNMKLEGKGLGSDSSW